MRQDILFGNFSFMSDNRYNLANIFFFSFHTLNFYLERSYKTSKLVFKNRLVKVNIIYAEESIHAEAMFVCQKRLNTHKTGLNAIGKKSGTGYKCSVVEG